MLRRRVPRPRPRGGGLGVPVPEAGHEVDDGEYVVDLAWPDRRIAVSVEVDDDRDRLAGRSTAGRSCRRTRQRYARQWRERADGRDHVEGVPPGSRRRRLDEGQGLGLRHEARPRGGSDRARPQEAEGRRPTAGCAPPGSTTTSGPSCSRSATRTSPCGCSRRSSRTTTPTRHAETLTLTVNPANGAMEVLRDRGRPARRSPTSASDAVRRRPAQRPALHRSPISSALGMRRRGRRRGRPADQTRTRSSSWPATCRSGSNGRLLDLTTGTSLDDVRATYAVGPSPPADDDPVEAVRPPDEPHAVRLPRRPTTSCAG